MTSAFGFYYNYILDKGIPLYFIQAYDEDCPQYDKM